MKVESISFMFMGHLLTYNPVTQFVKWANHHAHLCHFGEAAQEAVKAEMAKFEKDESENG